MDDTENNPWAAPPDWVHLPDVPGWIERRLGFPGLPLVEPLISALRNRRLTYRIGGLSRALDGYDRLPDGMTVERKPNRVVASDWEKAEPDWQAGMVAGRELTDGSRSRHRIEVSWLAIERWAPPVARDLAYHARKAAALAAKPLGPALPAPAVPGPLPFPEASYWSAWSAVAWRAFGTLDAPGHIIENRSFDGGTSQLPDESDADHAARQDEHRRFDAAEREVMDLLASGRTSAKGQPPAEGGGHKPKHGGHTNVPADAFLDQELAFDPEGNLIVRLDIMSRLFPPLKLRGTEASPEHPLWHKLLIEAAGLREAWGLNGIASLLPASEQPSPPTADAPAPAPRKRTHTGQDWRADDGLLVEEMRRMIDAGEAPSATNAARAVVEQAKGAGKLDSKVARLVALYGKTHPAV